MKDFVITMTSKGAPFIVERSTKENYAKCPTNYEYMGGINGGKLNKETHLRCLSER